MALILALVLSTHTSADQMSGKLLYTDKTERLIVRDLASGKDTTLKTKARFPKWSPDGKKILFYTSGRTHNNEEIYLIDETGENRRRVTSSPQQAHARYPEWGDGGKKIYFTRDTVGLSKASLEQLRIAENTTKPETVDLYKYLRNNEENPGKDFRFYPSYDSQYALIAFKEPYELHLVDLGRQETLVKIPFPDGFSDAGWSKDSKRVAIGTGSFNEAKLIILNTDGAYELVTYPKPEEVGCGSYSWSKDGRYIAMDCREPFSEDSKAWVYIFDLKTKKTRKLLRGANPDLY